MVSYTIPPQTEFTPLVRLLAVASPSTVYNGASREAIFQGFKLYQDMAVSSIEGGIGGDDSITLRFSPLKGDCAVIIALRERNAFSAKCSCGDEEFPTRCPHVVCALMTVMNLLKPGVFKMNKEDRDHRKALIKDLFPEWKGAGDEQHEEAKGPHREDRIISLENEKRIRKSIGIGPEARKDSAFRIIAENKDNEYEWHIEKDGLRLPDTDAVLHDLPFELKNLIYRDRLLENTSDALMWYFRSFPKARHLVLLKIGEELFPLAWNESLPHKTWTSLDVHEGTVSVTKGVSLSGGTMPGIIMGHMATGRSGGDVCQVENKDGWTLWEIIHGALRKIGGGKGIRYENGGATFLMTREVFQKLDLSMRKAEIERLMENCRFAVDGIPAQPELLGMPRYRVCVEELPGEDACLLRGECVIDRTVYKPLNAPFHLIRAIDNRRTPKSMKRKGVKEELIDMLFRTMAQPNAIAVTELLNREANPVRSPRPNVVRFERSLVRNALSLINGKIYRFLLAGHGWAFAATDRQREVLLYSIPCEIFGHAIFRAGPHLEDVMVVDRQVFAARFNIFDEKMRHSGIEISYKDMPLTPVSWDFAIDAVQPAAIDWFELRPEIACSGKAIDRQVWEMALKNKGVVVRDGVMEVLDAASLEKLARIAQVTAKPARGRREVISMPRLRMLELLYLRREGIEVRLSGDDENLLQSLAGFRGIDEKPLPAGLAGTMRGYQKEGYWWISFLYEHRFGGCLADDMGLGKTLQAIAFLGALKEGIVGKRQSIGPSLVVAPPSLIFNWEQEIQRFYPGTRIAVYRGGRRSPAFKDVDVVLTSYGLVLRDIEQLQENPFEAVIFDEAQAIKNIFAGTTTAVRKLKARFKLALTGTPVENHLGEYFSIIDLVLPGLLGDYREFQHEAKYEATKLLPKVARMTKPFLLRRTKDLILKELPPRMEHDVYLDLTQKQKAFYNRTVDEVREAVEKAYKDKTSSQANVIALTAIMKLRQICLTPELLVPEMNEPSPKVDFLATKIDELFSESHSALVFSQFTSFLDIVEPVIKEAGYPLLRLDGSTPVVQRKKIVEAFQNSSGPAVFLLSLKAGGQGLNLTKASYVFHLDPWWNPAVENQASDRAHRIGQTRSVMVTRLLMRHTVEEKMMELKMRKMKLYRALLQSPESGPSTAITKEDFDFLLSGG